MRKAIFYFLFFLNISFSFSQTKTNIYSDLSITIDQNIKGEIEVSKMETNSDYILFYPYSIKVEQFITMRDNKTDSLVLKIEHPSAFNLILLPMFFHNIRVNQIKRKELISLDYKFDGKELIIQKPTTNILISYEFQSDYFFKMGGSDQPLVFFQPQLYEWHSWYFTHPTMCLSEVKFTCNNDNTMFFANNFRKKGSNYFIDTKKNKDNNISFYLFNSKYYQTEVTKENDIQLNLHLSKGIIIDSIYSLDDSLRKIKLLPANMTSNINILTLKNVLNTAPDIFSNRNIKQIDIADAYLEYKTEDEKKLVWGNSTRTSSNSYFLLVDTSFWRNNENVTHEILHAFAQDENYKTDSAKYFFKESLIEYLAVYLTYEDQVQQDSIFNSKMEYYNKLVNYKYSSIFNLDINQANGDDSGTNYIIYNKTPYLIHIIASEIGQNKFVNLLSEFYKQARKTQEYSFNKFENMIRKLVPEERWCEIVTKL